jgi:hypothetical protein
MYHLLYYSATLYFVFVDFVWFSRKTAIISLNNVNQLIFVMAMCGVLFEVRTEFLNNIKTRFGFKGLNLNKVNQLIFVRVKCGVLFKVRTEFLNNI